MLFKLLRLFVIFIWIRRLFWLVTLPVRMVREMVSDFRKFFRFIYRLFTPSFWSSLRLWMSDGGLASIGKKIAVAVVFLVLGVGTLFFIAGLRQSGNARGGQALTASPTPPGEIKKDDGRQPEVRRAIAVSPPVAPDAVETLYMVAGVATRDSLNVHTRASASSPVVAHLPNGYNGVKIVGEPVMNETTKWVQVRFGERTGWVTKVYLKPE